MEPTMGHAPLHHDERNPGLVYLLQLLQSACFNPSPDNWQVSQAIWRGSFVKMEDERCMRPAQLACKSQCTSDLDPLPDALFHPATGRGVPICANARKLPGHIRAPVATTTSASRTGIARDARDAGEQAPWPQPHGAVPTGRPVRALGRPPRCATWPTNQKVGSERV